MSTPDPIAPVPPGAPTRTPEEATEILQEQLDRLAPRAAALGEEGVLSVAAWTLMHAYEFEAAELGWRRVLDEDPKGVEALFHQGCCQLELGRYADAADAFRGALELDATLQDDPDSASLDWMEEDPAYRLGVALHAMGDLDAALDAYEVSAVRNTFGVEALREMTRCHLASGRPSAAITCLDRLEKRAARLSVRAEMIALRAEAERARRAAEG